MCFCVIHVSRFNDLTNHSFNLSNRFVPQLVQKKDHLFHVETAAQKVKLMSQPIVITCHKNNAANLAHRAALLLSNVMSYPL